MEMAPSRPTLSMALASRSPIERSLLAEMAATWAISCDVAQGLAMLLELGHHGLDGQLDAALEVHRVHAAGQVAQAFLDHAVRQHGGGGGAVAGHLAGARGHLAQQLRAHVLEPVFQLDRLGHQHAGIHDLRRAEVALQNDGAPARPQRDLDGLGQRVDAAADLVAGGVVEEELLGGHVAALACCEDAGNAAAAGAGSD